MWATIKSKLILVGVGVITLLLGIIKYLSFTRGVYKDKAKRAETTLKRQSDINEMDSELDQEFKSKKAEIKAEIDEKKSVDSLENPNDF